MIKKSIVPKTFLVVAAVVFMLSGCRDKSSGGEEQVVDEALPAVLQQLQGHWKATSANKDYAGELICQDYTLRVRFSAQDVELKRNARIQYFGPADGQFMVCSDDKPWNYSLSTSEAGESLIINFYNEDQGDWVFMEMSRCSSQVVSCSLNH